MKFCVKRVVVREIQIFSNRNFKLQRTIIVVRVAFEISMQMLDFLYNR